MRPSLLYRATRLAFVAFALVFFGFPFYWAARVAFADPAVPLVPSWSMLYPQALSTSSFERVLPFFDVPIRNSVIVAGATAIASTTLAVGAGYALSRMRYGRGIALGTVLVMRILPPVAVMIPIFLLAARFHLRDLSGLILIYTALTLPFSMLIIYLAMRRLPVEIEEAALIDGCTRRQAAFLMARLALPGLIAAAIFAFVLAWAEFTIATILTLTMDRPLTLSVALNFPPNPIFDPAVAPLLLVGALPGLVLALLIQQALKRGDIIGR